PIHPLFPSTTLFRSGTKAEVGASRNFSKKSSLLVTAAAVVLVSLLFAWWFMHRSSQNSQPAATVRANALPVSPPTAPDQKSVARSEEHTSELQSLRH